jgi:hypothetical protein
MCRFRGFEMSDGHGIETNRIEPLDCAPGAKAAREEQEKRERRHMAASLSHKIRELKGFADVGELDGDDLEFIERIDELTGNAAALLSEAEAKRVDEFYKALGG